MRLHKQPGFFLVGLTQILTCLDGFGEASIEIGRLRDASAIGAPPAEIRKPVSGDRSEAVQRLREHQRQRVFARSLPARKHHRMRKAITRQHIAQAMNGIRVAVKIRKRHSHSSPRRRARGKFLQRLFCKLLRVSVTAW